MSNSDTFIFLNDELVQREKAVIPAVTSGLYYGVGCFETFLCERGKIFKYDNHIARMNKGLIYLGVPKENTIRGREVLKQIKKLLVANNLLEHDARIRIQVSLQEESGYSKGEDPSLIILITSQAVNKGNHPRRLVLADTTAVPSASRPSQFKLSNMLHYRQAFREAEQEGKDDAVMLNIDGWVSETSIANLFWMKAGTIFTPSGDCDILPGIMRKSLIDILENNTNYKVNEGKFKMNDLLEADFTWVTNSVMDVVPVSQIGDVMFEADESFFCQLKDRLAIYKKEYMTDV